MGKIKDICAVCESKKLLNYARLCKRCNREKAGVKVKNVVLKDLVAKAEEAAEQQELEAKQAAGRNKVEETTEESATPSEGEAPAESDAKKEETQKE